jgi:hypothetical protein
MPQVLMKTGEMKEIPDHELLNFLQENRDLIKSQKGKSRRLAYTETLANTTNTK